MSTLWEIVNVLGVVTLGLVLFMTSAILVALIAMTIGSLYHRRKNEANEDKASVVRCELCQYSHRVIDPFSNQTVYFCDVHQHQVQQDGFCSSGNKGVK